ncbi:MAG: sugar kinase [Rhodothermales bacterium]|nr:sugar kinase [Rhodothermales bacterium]
MTLTDMGKVTAVGEILVEMMSTEPGHGFTEPQTILGPYPSGAPAIFIDQVAKLGVATSIVGSVGDDDFGKVNTRRLERDGVDISSIAISKDRATGIAFVRYRPDGDRDFLFTLNCSAASQIDTDDMKTQLASSDHLHIVGSSLTMKTVGEYVEKAIPVIKSQGGTISFDPNVRPEIMQNPELYKMLHSILLHSDIVLPSMGELPYFCNAEDDASAIAELLEQGIPEIVLKRGKHGASRHTLTDAIHHAGFQVDEIDPTGAGDCFGATYVACRRLGQTAESALEHACAAGALAVLAQGPMEGTSSLEAIRAFIETNQQR